IARIRPVGAQCIDIDRDVRMLARQMIEDVSGIGRNSAAPGAEATDKGNPARDGGRGRQGRKRWADFCVGIVREKPVFDVILHNGPSSSSTNSAFEYAAEGPGVAPRPPAEHPNPSFSNPCCEKRKIPCDGRAVTEPYDAGRR